MYIQNIEKLNIIENTIMQLIAIILVLYIFWFYY